MELNFTGTDLCAVGGTRSMAETRYELIVVGAGPSGIAAAVEAANAGSKVLLVDENPVSGALMGNDIPLYFGGRMTAATQNSDRMVEAIFTSLAALESAMDVGLSYCSARRHGAYTAMGRVSRVCLNKLLAWPIVSGRGLLGLTVSCSPPVRVIWRWRFRDGTSRA